MDAPPQYTASDAGSAAINNMLVLQQITMGPQTDGLPQVDPIPNFSDYQQAEASAESEPASDSDHVRTILPSEKPLLSIL